MNTFETGAFTSREVDQDASYRPGHQWYLWNFFGQRPAPQLNQLLRDGSDLNFGVSAGQIATAAQVPGGFVGTAFGGGGYFEAEIAFDSRKVEYAKGWPAFWAMSLEHLTGEGDQWGSEPGYRRFIEVDAFEYDRPPGKPLQYGATLHEWYGVYRKTCPGPRSTYCSTSTPYRSSTKTAPSGTDWTKFHKVAFRWKPATESAQGSITFYFDGKQMGEPVPLADRGFSIIDGQHLVLILGGSPSGMRVRRVSAWQRSDSLNVPGALHAAQ